ncbi:hypothetical protein [Methylobacterium mesophilicum]|uniref:hypothetical protein n=1 Tax=Methylobacterium mesophilicum TaxID=39956 RepID=UPI0002C603CE|nr:hypothetical protein [Methylobacterium mesophilicum]
MTQNLQQTQQMQSPPLIGNLEARLERQETRLDGFGSILDNVVKSLGALSDKLDRRSATPWAVIWGAMGTCVTVAALIGGLAFYPLKDGQADLKSSLLLIQDKADKRIEALAANQVTRAEHEVHWRSQDRDYDFMRDRIGRVENRAVKGIDEMKARMDRLEDRVVSRSEVLARNEAQDRVTSMLRGEVDEHIRAFNERQQRRIDALENTPRR